MYNKYVHLSFVLVHIIVDSVFAMERWE